MSPLRASALASVVSLVALVSGGCGSGNGSGANALSCSASCTSMTWSFATSAGASAEGCELNPAAGGISQCSATFVDTDVMVTCQTSGQVKTCTGTITETQGGHQHPITAAYDWSSCQISVSVDGATPCTAP